MKPRLVIFWAVMVALVASSGCRKPEPQKPATPPAQPAAEQAVGQPSAAGSPAVAPPAEAPRPAITADEVAKVIGFGAELPADFQTFVMLDVAGARTGFQATSFGRKIESMVKEATGGAFDPPPGDPPVPAPENEPATAPTKDPGKIMLELLASGRCYLAGGPDTAEQTFNGLRLINFVQRLTTRNSLMEAADNLGLMGEDAEIPDLDEVIGKELGNIMARVEPAKMPGLVFAVACKGKIAEAKEMLATMDAALAETVSGEPYIKREEITREGGAFVTFSISPGDLVDADQIESTGQGVDRAAAERYHKILMDKKVVFGLGMKGDHVVFFLGSDPGQLRFVAKPSESLAARAEFEALAACKDRIPFLVAMADSTFWTKAQAGQDAGQIVDVAREVLERCTALGDTKDVAALLERVAESARQLGKTEDAPFCAAAWFDNGVRLEAAGGPGSPDLDGSQPLVMADRLATEDTVLWIDARSDRAYTAKALEMVEDLAEVSYELARRYADTEAGKEKGLADPLGMFHEKMLPHVAAAWAAVTGNTGLGSEGALVMDVGAAVPKFPGLPPAVAEKVHVPRLALVHPIEDRSKLDDTWKKLEPALRGLIESVPWEQEKKPTLPEPFTSEKNGVKTYFYGISGLTTDDFVPAVSVGEKYFFLGSSKTLAESLAARLAAPAAPAATAPRGMVVGMRFGPLARAATEWLDAMHQNAEAVFPDGSKREEFLSNEPNLRKTIDLLGGLDSLQVERRPAGTRWHTSVYLRFSPEPTTGPAAK